MKKYMLIIFCVALFAGCKESGNSEKIHSSIQNADTVISSTAPDHAHDHTTPDTSKNMDSNTIYYVNISTAYGDMLVKLYNETPKHRDNFIKLVKDGFYNDLLFHRVMQEFMIQGGDPNSKNAAPNVQLGSGGPGYTIPAEIKPGLYHKKGALAAARLSDAANPQKNSSGSQFYIVQGKKSTEAELEKISRGYGMSFSPEQKEVYSTIGGTPFLDNNYTVFGEVVKGLEVIDKIAAVKTNPSDRPIQDVKMKITMAEE